MPEESREPETAVVEMSEVPVTDGMKEEEISAREVAEVELRVKEVPEEEAVSVAVVEEEIAEVAQVDQVVAVPEDRVETGQEEQAVEDENRNKYQSEEVGKAYLCRTFLKKS